MSLTQELIDEILGGEHDTLLDAIEQAIRARRQAVATTTAALVRVGDPVRTQNVRPKYLSGVSGVVASKGNKKIRVQLAGAELQRVKARGGQRYLDFDDTIEVPHSCIERL